jgi:hypothetical protein
VSLAALIAAQSAEYGIPHVAVMKSSVVFAENLVHAGQNPYGGG